MDTNASVRILISKPEYEWECQWISIDGNKTGYPIHVNEAPQFFRSKNKDKLLIYYSASGNWTPYYCVGLLTAVLTAIFSTRIHGRNLWNLYSNKHQRIMCMAPVACVSYLHPTRKNGIYFTTLETPFVTCSFWTVGQHAYKR